ncbi:MAG: P1 family peptidase [Anaerolineales bacterium]|nr:P1 family peptidase [Anaerolineales bacterium]
MTLNLAGFQIGHATDSEFHTGCSVLLCPPQTTGGVDVRGPAPGSRETALLAPDKPLHYVNAVLLTGGSAFGLAAADGVMRYLHEREIGHFTPIIPIPIVPAAVVFDLGWSRGRRTPDAEMGYAACLAARDGDVPQGNVGAGAGVTVGKWGGFPHLMKGGFGAASETAGALIVGAMAVTNSVGDVVAEDGTVLAGARGENGRWLAADHPLRFITQERLPLSGTNTTLLAVWTNAALSVPEVNRLAQRAHDGMAIAIRPVHATHDGDTAFALASGLVTAPFDLVANMAVAAVTAAIRSSVRHARSVPPAPGLAG